MMKMVRAIGTVSSFFSPTMIKINFEPSSIYFNDDFSASFSSEIV